MRHSRVFLASALGLAAALLILWGTDAQAQNGAAAHSAQALGGPATLPPDTFAGPCKPWAQVNDGAFGLGAGGDGSYDQEEGFEVLVFDGRLYVGMEADNTLGARLWRTRSGVRIPWRQADWEEVAADGSGNPFGLLDRAQNDHVDSLAGFGGALYASTANRSGVYSGTLIYTSTSGAAGSWTQAISAGFGYTQNTNFKDMTVFRVGSTDWLCGGSGNEQAGVQVWCTADGVSWAQKNASGFGLVSNTLTASTGVFSGALYVGVVNAAGGSVWRTADLAAWTQVYTATDRPRVEVIGELDGCLYVAEGASDGRAAADPTMRIYRSSTGDAGAWSEVGAQVHGDAHNTRTIVDGGAVYNGALYVAVMNATSGAEVWRTTNGVDWAQVGADGFGISRTFAAELIPFDGYLYAWTSNYTSGQQVLRTACPICQERAISDTGRFDFAGVGAALTFSVESLDAVTVCVYPAAWPTTQTTALPVARYYEIAISPAAGTFTADLAFSYSGAELDASGAASDTLYLTRWTGSGWADCPPEQRSRDTLSNTVACRDVTAFSTWAIAGSGGAPSRVGMVGLRVRDRRVLGAWLFLLPVILSGALLALRRRR
jgi:hypothetical protein